MFKSGMVRTGYHGENYDALYIGNMVLAEELEQHWQRKNVYFAVAFSPNPIPPERMLEIALEQADGLVDAEYTDHFSDYTGYLWTDEGAKIGGHDLMQIFRSHKGEYGALLIDTEPLDLESIGNPIETVEYYVA